MPRITCTVNELTKEYLAERNGVAVADLPLYDKYVQQHLLIYYGGLKVRERIDAAMPSLTLTHNMFLSGCAYVCML